MKFSSSIQNVGPVEKAVRIGLGILASIAAVRLAKKSKWATGLLGLAGISGLQSGITGYCAVKNRFGWGTELSKGLGTGSTSDATTIGEKKLMERIPFDETEAMRESLAI